MVAHDAEVADLETIALLRAGMKNKEKIPNLAAIEEHLTAVRAHCHVVPGACVIHDVAELRSAGSLGALPCAPDGAVSCMSYAIGSPVRFTAVTVPRGVR